MNYELSKEVLDIIAPVDEQEKKEEEERIERAIKELKEEGYELTYSHD